MSVETYPHLFQPIRIGKTLFRNRIFAAPNGCQYLDSQNGPSPDGVAFFERKALGGFASVTLGECIVDRRTGQAHAYQILLDNPQALPPMSSVATAISRHGAVASAQLQHCGMYSHLVYERGGRLLGPVDAAIPDVHTTNNDGHEVPPSPDGLRHVRGMTEEEIEALIRAYGRAAALLKQAGFGMVIYLQNMGNIATYSSHSQIGMFCIAALLVGGASVDKASIGNVFLGVILFHTMFIVAPKAGATITGDSMIGEYFRVFVSYAVITVALIMYETKKRKHKSAAAQQLQAAQNEEAAK